VGTKQVLKGDQSQMRSLKSVQLHISVRHVVILAAAALAAVWLAAFVPAAQAKKRHCHSGYTLKHVRTHQKGRVVRVWRCVKKHAKHAGSPSTTGSPTTTPPPGGSGGTTTPPPASNAVPFPLGAYQCWQTAPSTDPLMPAGTYGSSVVTTVTFNGDGTYHKSNDYVGGNWHESGNTIVFTSGLLWQSGSYDQGVIYPSGTTMPHATSPAPASGYTLVIKDTVQEGGNPPSQEFSSTDGPNGSYSPPESFFYCKM